MSININVPNVGITLLREQRDRLLVIQLNTPSNDDKQTLEGIINLLDAMLDIAEVK